MWFIILPVLFLVIYLYLKLNFKYWDKRSVPNPPASILFGNIKDALTLNISLGVNYMKIYNNYKDLPYVGVYKVRKPAILLRDTDLIKNVMIRDFKSFHNNDFVINEEHDPIFGKNPFVLRDEKWKIGRNQMTPSFTSGKMKSSFDVMVNVGKKLQTYLENNQHTIVNDGIEAKELCSLFACDIVGEAGFGLNVMALEDPNSIFRKMTKKIFDQTLWSNIKQFFILLFPTFSTIFKIKLMSDEVQAYIKDFVDQAVKYREKNNIVQNDYLGNMMQIKQKSNGEFTDIDLYAHIGGLLIDGIETSSVAIQFSLYELAINPDVQNRLKEEIDKIYEKYDGNITYESFQEMTYLDRVFKEGLRKYPPLQIAAKVCTEPYTFPPCKPTSIPLQVEVGTPIVIPTLALHYDEKYYPEPNRFNPDRYLDENLNGVDKFAYLPFGNGPRVCIGRRFGEQQSKIAIMSIVRDFEIRLNKKTISPLQFEETPFFSTAKGGIWLNFHKRK